MELLGNYTQRRPTTALIGQLDTLLGRAPSTKQEANEWKRGLRRRTPRELPPRRSAATRALAARVHLPEGRDLRSDRRVGRAFSLLETMRRRFDVGKAPSAHTAAALCWLIGVAPASAREVHVVARALSTLAHRRRHAERVPPRYPATHADLQRASMLLGLYARRGRVGAQTDALRSRLGGLPRTRNVARSWKKLVDRERVRMVRRERAAVRRAAADKVRRQRKFWRELPQWARDVVLFGRRIRNRLIACIRQRK